jgi:hypothetical protein
LVWVQALPFGVTFPRSVPVAVGSIALEEIPRRLF